MARLKGRSACAKPGLLGGLLLAAAFGLCACGVGVRQSPASDEDTGNIHAVAEQSGTYTTQPGDTLERVAARPDVYGDPELWPLILDANAQTLAGKSPGALLGADTVLVIPRDASPAEIEAARGRARSLEAERKLHERAAAPRPVPKAGQALVPSGGAPKPAPTAAPTAPPAVPTAVPTPAATPIPAAPSASAKGGRTLPLVLLLLLVLAALAAVFFVFFRRDKKDFD